MKLLAWMAAVLLVVAGLSAVDWSFAASIAFIGVAVLLLTWVASETTKA